MMKEKAKKRVSAKTLVMAWILSTVLVIGGTVGVSLAWLTAKSDPVTNTFTESNIVITLKEDMPVNRNASMIPGLNIGKDPEVTVEDSSEDCWLFVKITESTTPKLDDYIAYAIKDLYNAKTNPSGGWQIVEESDSEVVIGRRVYKNDTTKTFSILGAGTYNDPMGTDEIENDDYEIKWSDDEVGVKPSVNEDMMTAITGKTQPTLKFEAYAVQLYKENGVEFLVQEAWARRPIGN